MKLVQINEGCGVGSIGKICVAVSQMLTEKNVENYIFYTYDESSYPLGIKYSNTLYTKFQALKSRITGNYGFTAKSATKKLIRRLKEISPDIVHLHNLHAHNVDLEVLFDYIKENKIKTYWTFHDCWAFTGYCPHFTMAKCDKWMTGCGDCPQRREYTWFFDNSAKNWQRKKNILNSIDLTVVTPSKWLAGLVEKSIFSNFPIKVLNNGINLDVFKPTESDFRKKFNCEDKIILLGVAFGWGPRKGLDVFIELSKRLDEKYQIVLVGTDEDVDKILPDNIISIHRTQNQKELAEIYSAADLFVNPTREDTFPTVNMESIACGTPVVTFDVGGCRETILSECGICNDKDDITALIRNINYMIENIHMYRANCNLKRMSYDEHKQIEKYISLYGI